MSLNNYKLPDPREIKVKPISSKYPTPPVLPKRGQHPRVLFKEEEIKFIKDRFSAVQNQCAKAELDNLIKINQSGILPDKKGNASGKVLSSIEAMAFDYAVNKNVNSGYMAISAIKNYINTVNFEGVLDYSRPIGHIIFVVGEVYDWCYSLIGDEDKKILIAACEQLASKMEINYPPSGQGAIVGHAGEAQLLRDLLCFSIAVYDQRPDIYNYCAGRIFAEFIEPRNHYAKSHTHHQGSAYGFYRYYFDMWSVWLIYKMSNHTLYDSNYRYIPYEWLYIRRPDGQLLRIGDDYNEGKLRKGQYWDETYVSFFMASNFYNDPYLKQECIRESEGFSRFIYDNATITPTHYLIMNNPDLWGSPLATLPLTKYFASPAGIMVARSSWDTDINTDKAGNQDINAETVLAYMKIGELWAGNHHHLDAGNFQIYYKGILASESGFYDSYYSEHDKCYNKETIAHNSLLVYDKDEVVLERPNSGGQRRPSLNEPANMEEWMKDNKFVTGKVLAHHFGPDPNLPEYSYISGDISKAYTNKVSEVIRSMLFMPVNKADIKAVMIVADKISATNSKFKKTFLLHCQQEPEIQGNIIKIQNTDYEYRGALQMHSLLPKNKELSKIGGKGKEFTINDKNYPTLKPIDPALAAEPGAWRIELSPKEQNTTDYFLNVMLIGELGINENNEVVHLIETEDLMGVQVLDRVCVFNKSASPIKSQISFNTKQSNKPLKIAVAGLSEGEWYIMVNGNIESTQASTKDGGIIYFDAASGRVELKMVKYNKDSRF